ncbi:hypothetical protein PR048_009973, partial [Dryococelus australis]
MWVGIVVHRLVRSYFNWTDYMMAISMCFYLMSYHSSWRMFPGSEATIHDGAPPQYGLNLRNCLNQRFHDHWNDRGGPGEVDEPSCLRNPCRYRCCCSCNASRKHLEYLNEPDNHWYADATSVLKLLLSNFSNVLK